MNNRPKTIGMIAQAVILAALMLLILWSGVNTVSVSAVISMITTAIVIGFLRWKRMADVPESDERTKKLGAYAATYSWLLTLVFITLLFWVDNLAVVKLTVTQALGTTLLVMLLTMSVFRWYLNRKGDVE
jgi:uncharacterized BrkB/YihY/UPF0761 family membrane protein